MAGKGKKAVYEPVKDLIVEEAGEGAWRCELAGGAIEFTEREGRFHVAVSYEDAPGRHTHFGPFASLADAGYRITHGVIPLRMVGLLADNGILARGA